MEVGASRPCRPCTAAAVARRHHTLPCSSTLHPLHWIPPLDPLHAAPSFPPRPLRRWRLWHPLPLCDGPRKSHCVQRPQLRRHGRRPDAGRCGGAACGGSGHRPRRHRLARCLLPCGLLPAVCAALRQRQQRGDPRGGPQPHPPAVPRLTVGCLRRHLRRRPLHQCVGAGCSWERRIGGEARADSRLRESCGMG